jgi:hypothetical protein
MSASEAAEPVGTLGMVVVLSRLLVGRMRPMIAGLEPQASGTFSPVTSPLDGRAFSSASAFWPIANRYALPLIV